MLTVHFFGALATFISFVSFAFYAKSIIQRKTKPHFYSWFNWFLLTTIGAVAQDHVGGGASAWVLYLSAFNCFLITIASLCLGEKSITRGDTITFLSALIIIPVWLISKDPLLAITLLITIDLLCFYPTVRKTYHQPYSEDLIAYMFAGLRYFIALFAIEKITLSNLAYPLFLMGIEWGFAAYLIYLRMHKINKARS